MTQMPTLLPNHAPTAAELATITTAITRSFPIKGIRITNTGGPIATTTGTTELDLSKHSIPGLTLVANRYYMAVFGVTFTKTVAGDSFDLKLRVNTAVSGTQIGQHGFNPTDGLSGGYREFGIIFLGDTSFNSLYLSAVRSSGTGTFSYYGANTTFVRSWSILCDMGDSDNWSDAG